MPPEAQHALGIIQKIFSEYFRDHKECVVGSGGKSVGYLAHGTATDSMFERMRVPMAYTWEIFGDLKVHIHVGWLVGRLVGWLDGLVFNGEGVFGVGSV